VKGRYKAIKVLETGDGKELYPAMPTEALKVVCFLQLEYSCEFANREEGFCVKISVQSITTRTLGKQAFILAGICLSMASLEGQMLMDPKTTYNVTYKVNPFQTYPTNC